MDSSWKLQVFEQQREVYSIESAGSIELGRQDKGEDPPYALKGAGPQQRLTIARLEEDKVPRKYVVVEPLLRGRFKLTNLSKAVPLRLENAPMLQPGSSAELLGPVSIIVGTRTICIGDNEANGPAVQSLPNASIPPGRETPFFPRLGNDLLTIATSEMDKVVSWLRTAIGVLHGAAYSPDFFQRAAQAVVNLVGLDSVRVLLREQGEWKVKAWQTVSGRDSDGAGPPSRKILQSLLDGKRAVFEMPPTVQLESLRGVDAVVAAPILDREGQVIGALYGDRRRAALKPITKLEASLVELLASGVAAGLARLEQEKEALKARVQFEQFFTPELSRQLTTRPELLEGRDCQVSVLFCDIRGFSRVSEKFGPARTVEWINDILGVLSQCVLDQQGVLVDYIGDELMAMWGAPGEQPDHAQRACRAALAMLRQLPKLNERWQPVLDETLGLGIGVNSGPARVGNVGSSCKFKYGPLGNTVNLGSRVQGANKYLKTRLLITAGTQEQLGPQFNTRRLCHVRVINIEEPVALYELFDENQSNWPVLKRGYEEALEKFEQREFRAAARILANLLMENPHDGPTLVLLARATGCLVEDPQHFDCVWELPGK